MNIPLRPNYAHVVFLQLGLCQSLASICLVFNEGCCNEQDEELIPNAKKKMKFFQFMGKPTN